MTALIISAIIISNNKSSHQRLDLQSRSFGNFSKVLEKIFQRVCFLVKLQIVDHNLIKNEFHHRHVLRIFAKILVT